MFSLPLLISSFLAFLGFPAFLLAIVPFFIWPCPRPRSYGVSYAGDRVPTPGGGGKTRKPRKKNPDNPANEPPKSKKSTPDTCSKENISMNKMSLSSSLGLGAMTSSNNGQSTKSQSASVTAPPGLPGVPSFPLFGGNSGSVGMGSPVASQSDSLTSVQTGSLVSGYGPSGPEQTFAGPNSGSSGSSFGGTPGVSRDVASGIASRDVASGISSTPALIGSELLDPNRGSPFRGDADLVRRAAAPNSAAVGRVSTSEENLLQQALRLSELAKVDALAYAHAYADASTNSSGVQLRDPRLLEQSQSRSETATPLSQPPSRGGGLRDQETDGCDNQGSLSGGVQPQGSLSGGVQLQGRGVLPLHLDPYSAHYGFAAPSGPHSSARNESSSVPPPAPSADLALEPKIDYLCHYVRNISDRLTNVEQRDVPERGPGRHQVSAPSTVPSDDAMDCDDGDVQSLGDDSSLLELPEDSGELSDMKKLRALIRYYVPAEFCPLPPEGPSLPSASFNLFGGDVQTASADPTPSRRALEELPPSPSILECAALLDDCLRDGLAETNKGLQRAPISTLPSMGPDAWIKPGKVFTATIPSVGKYKPDYYRVGASGPSGPSVCSVLRDDHEVRALSPNVFSSQEYKDIRAQESLAKDSLSALSYAELSMFALARSLQQETLSDDSMSLLGSLQHSIRHAIALTTKCAANSVLYRRDSVLHPVRQVTDTTLRGALRTCPMTGAFLFADRLRDGVQAQQEISTLYGSAAPKNRARSAKSSRTPVQPRGQPLSQPLVVSQPSRRRRPVRGLPDRPRPEPYPAAGQTSGGQGGSRGRFPTSNRGGPARKTNSSFRGRGRSSRK